MGLVVIEGVVRSDVCELGARHTVQWTDHLAGLVRNGLVRVVEHVAPEPAPVKRRRAARQVADAERSLASAQKDAAAARDDLAGAVVSTQEGLRSAQAGLAEE